MEDLSYLQNMSQHDYEFERHRLIYGYIDTLPEDRRQEAMTFQVELDVKRFNMTTEEFLSYLSQRIGENLENLQDLCNSTLVQLERENDDKPRLTAISNVTYLADRFTTKK